LRLNSINEYSDLGSGFVLSGKDLEIRGAGNLLGVEQSGGLDRVGYRMYMDMVSEAVQKYRREGGLQINNMKQSSDFVKHIWLR